MFLATTIRVATLLTCTPISSECQNGHASHDQLWQDSNIDHPVPAPGLRSQPDLPNYPSHQPFPVQVYQDQLHRDGPYGGSLHDASIPTQEEYPVSCGWLDGRNVRCGFQGSYDAFKAHFISRHLTGPQDALIVCRWEDCRYTKRGHPDVRTMRRDCAWRHAREIHLRDKYRRVQAT